MGPAGVRRSDSDRLVSKMHRERLAGGFAVGNHSLDPEGRTGAKDAKGDLTAVRDQDLAEHQPSVRSAVRSGRETSSMTTSSWPYSTASPGSASVAPTIPSAGATTSCGTPSMST